MSQSSLQSVVSRSFDIIDTVENTMTRKEMEEASYLTGLSLVYPSVTLLPLPYS